MTATVDGSERGGAVGVEMALLWVVLILLVLTVVQMGLVFYAGQLALTAAENGVHTARYLGQAQPAEIAKRDALAFLDQAAGSSLSAPIVTAAVDPITATVRVAVTGEALSIVPGVHIRVSREAVGGLERISP